MKKKTSKSITPQLKLDSNIYLPFNEWRNINCCGINEIINITCNELKAHQSNNISTDYKTIIYKDQLEANLTKLIYNTSFNSRKKYNVF